MSISEVVRSDQTIINDILECLRPYIEADGGGIQFVSLIDNTVSLRMAGACVGCPASYYTQVMVIEKTIKTQVPTIKQVIFVE